MERRRSGGNIKYFSAWKNFACSRMFSQVFSRFEFEHWAHPKDLSSKIRPPDLIYIDDSKFSCPEAAVTVLALTAVLEARLPRGSSNSHSARRKTFCQTSFLSGIGAPYWKFEKPGTRPETLLLLALRLARSLSRRGRNIPWITLTSVFRSLAFAMS